MAKIIEIQTPPNILGEPRMDFDKNKFDILIQQKGYDVVYENALRCPCKDKQRPGYLPSCKNCGGTGWVFINPTKTRMILHSMNLPTQYRPWSIENVGTVSITVRDVDHLSYMDKITVPYLISTFSQHLNPVIYQSDLSDSRTKQLFGFTIYPLKLVLQIFQFVDSDHKLTLLSEGMDYTYVEGENKIKFAEVFQEVENLSFTVRYKHPTQFYALDFPRDLMMTPILDSVSGYEVKTSMPVSAIGRRIHYVLDPDNYQGSVLFDNSISK